ncbi:MULTISPECIES: DMT family transporter [Haloferax]|uniref:EamA family transporter n=1 Tax=Haloferax marinum TaxID=2666143 RepID=A0A6A8G7D2_9EURY|nr:MULTISPECIES: DMT family transporter [Haloferax]KAB1197693.1 DMT family transporter [Haloferax sp. CBA1150]MRW96747.1 EamA family transporter [Haloferax marinum]
MNRTSLFGFAPLLASALWGGMYVVSKWGFDAIPPLTLAFLRIVLGAAALGVVVAATTPRRAFDREEWRRFGGLAVWLTAALTTQFVGTDLTNASQGSVLTVLTPVFILALGVAVLGERLSRRSLVGSTLAVFGTLGVLAGRGLDGIATNIDPVGVALLVLSSFFFAGFTVYGKPVIRRYSALEAVTYATILSVPLFGLFVPFELATRDVSLLAVDLTPAVVGAVLYLGVASTAAAWYFWYKGMEYTDASHVAVFFFAQPVVGTLLGVAFLGEQVDVGFVVGGVVLAVGVYLVSTDSPA